MISSDDFAKSIKAKYPQYANVDNATLTAAMLKKYPQYQSQVQSDPAAGGGISDKYGQIQTAADYAKEQGSYAQEKATVASEKNVGLKTGAGAVIEGAFSGAPIAPENATDDSLGGIMKSIGKMGVNVLSDTPTIAKGLANLVAHPIDGAKGIVDYYTGIATESLNALETTLETGDTTRLAEDLKKARIALVDHPVQTVLAIDGARAGFEAAADLPGKVKNVAQTTADIYNNGSKSSLAAQVKTVSDVIDKKIDATKTLNDATKTLESFSDKQKDLETQKGKEITGTDEEIAAKKKAQIENTSEYQKAKNNLSLAKIAMDHLNEQHDAAVTDAAKSTQSEMATKGFSSLSDMQNGISNLARFAKEKLSDVYDQTLGSAKLSMNNVLSGFDKLQDYFKRTQEKGSLSKEMQGHADTLAIRDFVTKTGADAKTMYQEMGKPDSILSKIDKKTKNELQGMTPEEIQKKYPPLTSEDAKATLNNIREEIRQNNPSALKQFDENVGSAFKDAFRDAVKGEYGQERLSKIDATDRDWADLKKSSLFSKENPTLNDIQSGWKEFTTAASKLPEGEVLIKKIQSYTAEQILDGAERQGKYDFKKVATGFKKFGDVLGEEEKAKLQGVLDMNEQAVTSKAESAAKIKESDQAIKDSFKTSQETLKQGQKESETTKKGLQDEQDKIQNDMKDIGTTAEDVYKKITGISSVAELKDFLNKTGKSIDEVRAVTLQSIVESWNKEAGLAPNAKYNLDNIPALVKKFDDLGGNGPEAQKVSNEILGDKGKKFVNDLRDESKDLKEAKSAKNKSAAKRAITATIGALLTAMGHVFMGPHMIIRGLSGGGEDLPTGRERVQGGQGSGAKRAVDAASNVAKRSLKGAIRAGGVNAAAEDE